MSRYRRKPTEVDAVKWKGHPTIEVQELLRGCSYDYHPVEVQGALESGLEVTTVDGNVVKVPIGAYVVIDAKGYPYPCDAGLFEANHEPVT